MTHSITYFHPDTDEQYTITFTVQFAVKVPRESFDRFQEPEDDDEVEIVSIVNQNGIAFHESNFDKIIVQSMYDECYLSAVEL